MPFGHDLDVDPDNRARYDTRLSSARALERGLIPHGCMVAPHARHGGVRGMRQVVETTPNSLDKVRILRNTKKIVCFP